MASLASYRAHLEKMREQAKRLASDIVSLAGLFNKEANRLRREEYVSLLVALRSSIFEQLDREKSYETAAANSNSDLRLKMSLAGLTARVAINALSENRQLIAVSDYALGNLGNKDRRFGMVLVRIGPKVLPDDVNVVSVSRLSRESNRKESQVIKDLEERGYLLLSKEAFSFLIDRLVNDVRKGLLSLPISLDKLCQAETSG